MEEKPSQAPQFYLVIAIATVIGLGIAASGVGAIQALFIAAIINGVTSPLLIAAIVLVCNDGRIMGEHGNGPLSNILGVATVAIMGLAGLAMAVTFVFP